MKRIISALFILLVVASCGGEQKIDQTHESPEVNDSLLNAYFDIKDALVASDMTKTTAMAQSLADKTVDNEINKFATLIAVAPDLKAQRDHFEGLSNAMIAYAKDAGLSNEVHVQFCPMAFGNKGAHWLATEEAILNPYFGEMMLRCGVVKETIK